MDEKEILCKFLGCLIRKGKKELAINVVDVILFKLRKNLNVSSGLDILLNCLDKIRPYIVLQPKRVGGVIYRLPRFIKDSRSYSIAIRWILFSARQRSGKKLVDKIVSEFIDIVKNRSLLLKKKEEIYKIAVLNRGFIHYLKVKKKPNILFKNLAWNERNLLLKQKLKKKNG